MKFINTIWEAIESMSYVYSEDIVVLLVFYQNLHVINDVILF